MTNIELPAARVITRADLPRDQWLTERAKGIGGSDVSAIVGVNPYRTRWQVWLDKTSQSEQQPESSAMRWGKLLEPALRQAFTEDTGVGIHLPGMLQSTAHDWWLYTPDGITTDDGVFESKTTNWRQKHHWDDDSDTDGVSPHAAIQVHWGMLVTGYRHAWVVGLIDGSDFRVRRVEFDQRLADLIVEEVTNFWDNHIVKGIEPPITGDDLGAAEQRWSTVELDVVAPADAAELVDAYRAAQAFLKTAKAAADQAKAELVAAMGSAEAIADGGMILATRKQHTRYTFDSKTFGERYPATTARFTNETTYRTLRLKGKTA